VSALYRTLRAAYGGLPREAWLVAALELINCSGCMVLFFLTLYLTRRLGFSMEQAAWAMSAFGLGSMVGTYCGGRLCDRVGAYAVLQASLAAAGVLYLALAFPRSPVGVAVTLFVLAVTSQALHPASATITASVCPAADRARGFALNRLATNLGISIGPLAGGYLALIDYQWLFRVDGLTSLAAAGLAFACLPRTGPRAASESTNGSAHENAEPAGTSPWRNRGFVVLLPLAFGLGAIFNQIFSTFGPYLREAYGLDEASLGRLIAVNTALIITIEMPLMHALRAAAPTRVLAVGGALVGLGFGLMPFGHSGAWATFTVVVWTLGEILSMPTLFSLVAARAGRAPQGEYLGLTSLAFATSSLVGPAAGLALYARAGGDSVWYTCLTVGALLGLGFVRAGGEWRWGLSPSRLEGLEEPLRPPANG
jgi:predicted MFS family arabinose efflux permease